MFDRFYRGQQDDADGPAGSGLGLAIVQHIVQLHHATIRMGDSRFDSGLALTLQFPVDGQPS